MKRINFHYNILPCLGVHFMYGTICLEQFPGTVSISHDEFIKWKHFPRYWPFVRRIPRLPVNPPLKGQWRGALMFSWFAPEKNGRVNNRETGDFRRHRPPLWRHCNVIGRFVIRLNKVSKPRDTRSMLNDRFYIPQPSRPQYCRVISKRYGN